jgi:DNA-binding MarR family transcriptional regulator
VLISQFFPPAATSAGLVQEKRKGRKAHGRRMSRQEQRPTRQSEPAPLAAQVQAGHHLALGLRAAYLMMHRRANAVFSPFGLTADQFVLLTALAGGDGVTQKELARLTHSDPNTISEMLGRLERRGLIRRERHADDARALSVFLTKNGWAAHQRAMEGVAPFCQALAGLVPRDEGETLLGHLNRIAGGVSATDSLPTRGAGAR